MADKLTIDSLAGVVLAYADALRDYQEEINALNVYPVPDGDTGSNLRLTLDAVRSELESSPTDKCKSIIRGSLMGARGNSGVILSQILRGIAEEAAESGALDDGSLPRALRRASSLAYQAVSEPQEGTILTVAREAAEAAEEAAGRGVEAVVRAVTERATDALARTPELLPILKQAGVVDAGGRGFLLFLQCLRRDVDGTQLPAPAAGGRSPADLVGTSAGGADHRGSLEFAFEVQFLFEAPDEAASGYRDFLQGYGDCVLVVGASGLYNVHVHTNAVGPVIEEAIRVGRPKQIDVTYLEGQVAELHEAAVLARMRGEEPPVSTEPMSPLSLVAVGAGDGVMAIFQSLGVRGLVPGGQTFNPSAEEILDGIRAARGEEVIVLPNNRNVIAAARTAASVAVDEGIARRVEVLPTESPLQAFTALVAFDSDATIDDNLKAMATEGFATKHGEVAHAVRTAETPAGHVEAGQCLGLVDGKVEVVSDDPQSCVVDVLSQMVRDDDSLVTLVYGADIDEWSAHELGKRVAEQFGTEVEVHRGGQPHYPFLIGVE